MKLFYTHEQGRRERLHCLVQLISIRDNLNRTNYGEYIHSLEDLKGTLIIKANKDGLDVKEFEYSIKTCWEFLNELFTSFEYT